MNSADVGGLLIEAGLDVMLFVPSEPLNTSARAKKIRYFIGYIKQV